ncbi:1-phosphatidylinositol 4-5-bisphosphate phosphodiesterase epsilon-1 [Brachionus plicatilis]|uniref:1-phosphatidylinositol 4-5-bisphosphate phosphodiesterase epsilon-1 n=1 Tax=Brachionus plicatilis TaxID=10195 RepID=A0A3M7P956_BRAPC|nr:1-phosphatidylinositol 4-5-bisphosphate phosphodiesterase epsilon-1 [Brachionus plicatilis]
MLQGLGILALKPEYHDALLKYDLPDTIMSLILPGDELFYTNQTTKYPKYVKYLAARILVYLGLFEKVSNKVNLFDILEMQPEQIDLDRPQSFENNFIHNMAIGENLVIKDGRFNTAAIRIEKLLDNILKEIKNDQMDKIKFDLNENCDHLYYNMSYLCTLVHPLIIIRLLEHRLFTPLLKKSNSRKPSSFSLLANLKSIPTSTSFPSNNKLADSNEKALKPDHNQKVFRKCSEGMYERWHARKESQLSLTDKQQSVTKTAYLKDLSKKIMKRVNSGNQFGYSNFKKSFKYSRVRKNSHNQNEEKTSASVDSLNHSPEVVSSSFAQKKCSKSNTNSLDRSCAKETLYLNDVHLFNQPDLKEMEKNLINLPTFTISDEHASNTLPSSSCLVTDQASLGLNGNNCDPVCGLKVNNLDRNERRRKSDLIEMVKKNVNIFRKRNSLSLNHLCDNKNYFFGKKVNQKFTPISKSLSELSSNIKSLFKRSIDEFKMKTSSTETAKINLLKDKSFQSQLKAPQHCYHFRSNSPIDANQSTVLNKSFTSKNSAYSIGFLPSPDMNSPTLSSSIDAKAMSKNYSLGVIALTTAAATIGSSFILTNKQNEEIKNKLNSIQNELNSKSPRKLITSSSLTPITIQINDHSDRVSKTFSNNQIDEFQNKSCNRQHKDHGTTIAAHKTPSFSSDAFHTNKGTNPQPNKQGSEVLNLLSLWIKNSPNDFLVKKRTRTLAMQMEDENINR